MMNMNPMEAMRQIMNMNPQQAMQNAAAMRNRLLQNNQNANPEQIIRQAMQNGGINQQQFEMARNMLGRFGVKL